MAREAKKCRRRAKSSSSIVPGTTAPWTIVRSDIKKLARLNCIKYVLSQIDYADKGSAELLEVDSDIIISGIDELKMMDDNLMKPKSLPG